VSFQSDLKGGLVAVSAILLLTGLPVRADDMLLAPMKVTPRETRVLLLPALDATPDSADMLGLRRAVIRHRQEREFITRQFKVLGDAMAVKAADSPPKIDLASLSARTSRNLDLLAKRADADWVVSTVVQEVKMDSSDGGEFKIHTRVLLQIWDARRQGWLANNPYTSHTDEGGSPIFAFKDSLDDAAKDSLGNILGSYPQVISLPQEQSAYDYSAVQTGQPSNTGNTPSNP
jgi:hypothetical protein